MLTIKYRRRPEEPWYYTPELSNNESAKTVLVKYKAEGIDAEIVTTDRAVDDLKARGLQKKGA